MAYDEDRVTTMMYAPSLSASGPHKHSDSIDAVILHINPLLTNSGSFYFAVASTRDVIHTVF